MNLELGSLSDMANLSAQGVGTRIRVRREKLGLSQPKLAKILNSRQQTVDGWEHGKARVPRQIVDLAKALCTTPEWLLREEGPEEVTPQIPKQQIVAAIESLDPRLIPAALEFVRNLALAEQEGSQGPARKARLG